jgi:transcriptional regulator
MQLLGLLVFAGVLGVLGVLGLLGAVGVFALLAVLVESGTVTVLLVELFLVESDEDGLLSLEGVEELLLLLVLELFDTAFWEKNQIEPDIVITINKPRSIFGKIVFI